MDLVVNCLFQFLALIKIIDLIYLNCVLSLTLLLYASVETWKDLFTKFILIQKTRKFTVLFKLFVPISMHNELREEQICITN